MHSIAASLIAFLITAGIVTMSPGLDSLLVLRTAANDGARAAMITGLGIALGCLAWATLVAMGLGALLAASRLAYDLLRWAGAAYLCWLGYKLLRHPRRGLPAPIAASGSGTAAARHEQAAFVRGLLTNLLNPKVGVFYVSFLPQFVPAHVVAVGPYIMLLAVLHALEGLLWFTCLIMATQSLARWLQRSAVVSWLDRITGGLFIAFGVGLALAAPRSARGWPA
jgi:RhtB (resistance to homoserine/threonine) family protein